MKYLALFFFLALLCLPERGFAQRIEQQAGMSASGSDARIAAVVNDNVISSSDINDRIKLAMMSSNLPDNLEIRQKLLPQILRGLIDEQLEMQEAKRLDITVSNEDIDQALKRIAEENKIPVDMKTYISEHGGSPDALVQQVRAGISWNRVVTRELRPRVDVGDDEVDAVIQRIRTNAGKEEYAVSEILLVVDNPKEDEQVKQFGENLVQQLKGGANFPSVARQFSQGTGAATGGDIGWIQEGQLSPELNHALTSMQVGEIAGPIRSASGYHILGLREKRTITLGDSKDVKLNLQQAFRPYSNDITKEALLDEAYKLKASVTSCTGLQNIIASKFPDWHWNDLGDMDPNKGPSLISDKVRDLSVGQASEPLPTDKGALILFLCGRKVPEGNVNREAIVSSIGTEKLELQARRLLRDLRRDAYLDVRLSSNPS